MQTAIIISPQYTPAIIEAKDSNTLRGDILSLAYTPAALETLDDIKNWLASLPRPSGLYRDREAAIAAARAAAKAKRDSTMTPQAIADARHELDLSRVEFGRALGMNGNDNTVNKTIYEIEVKGKALRSDKVERLLALLAEHRLTKDKDAEHHAPAD